MDRKHNYRVPEPPRLKVVKDNMLHLLNLQKKKNTVQSTLWTNTHFFQKDFLGCRCSGMMTCCSWFETGNQ